MSLLLVSRKKTGEEILDKLIEVLDERDRNRALIADLDQAILRIQEALGIPAGGEDSHGMAARARRLRQEAQTARDLWARLEKTHVAATKVLDYLMALDSDVRRGVLQLSRAALDAAVADCGKVLAFTMPATEEP